MAVYVSFSDEADVGTKGGKFLVCGYVGAESEWPSFASAWQKRVLDGPPKIPYLHTNPLKDADWQKEHSILSREADRRIAEAVGVLAEMELVGKISTVGSSVHKSDLEVFSQYFDKKNRVPLGLNEPDYPCFIAYAVLVLVEAYKRDRTTERVDFVVSRKQKITHHLNDFKKDIKEWLKGDCPLLSSLVGDLIPASMEDQLPLQAADLLGWHIQRNWAGRTTDLDDRRLKILLEAPVTMFEWKRSHLEDILSGALLKARLRTGIE